MKVLIKDLAHDHRLNPDQLVSFAIEYKDKYDVFDYEKDPVNKAKTDTWNSDQLVKDFKHVNRKGHDWRENIPQNNEKNMRKMVKETLSEAEFYPGYENQTGPKEDKNAKIIRKIKAHCEIIIEGAEDYFRSLEEEGMDPEDLDMDELENYASNSSASDLANQILDIINKQR